MLKTEQNPKPMVNSGRAGIFLVLLGAVSLIAKMFEFSLQNWWAFFIFIPAAGLLILADGLARNGRSVTASRLFQALGLIVGVDATMFLFQMDWGSWWPLTLITVGFGLAYVTVQPTDVAQRPSHYAAMALFRWLGVTILLLGITFLLNQRFGLVLDGRFSTLQWWGIFPLITAVGLFTSANHAFWQQNGRSTSVSTFLTLIATLFAIGGTTELLHLDWNSINNIVGIVLVFFGSLMLINATRKKQLGSEAQ